MAGTRLKQKLTNIADTIRAGLNITNLMSIDEMPTNIDGIENRETRLIERSITGNYINEDVITLGTYAFYRCEQVETLSFPNATSAGSSVFYGCNSCKAIYTPKLNTIANYVFRRLPIIEAMIFENTTPPTLGGTGVFLENPVMTDGTNSFIYVPDEAVSAYEAAAGFSDLPTGKIKPLSETPQEYIDLFNIDITGASAESATVPPPAPLQTIPVNRLDIDEINIDRDLDLDPDLENNERI